ncbi:hypothetical protein Tco_0700771 [Tanacetum coccineum]
MSSPNHSTSDIEDVFSSMNILNYTSVSPDYFPALSGSSSFNSSENSTDNMIPPVFSSFYNNPWYYDDDDDGGVIVDVGEVVMAPVDSSRREGRFEERGSGERVDPLMGSTIGMRRKKPRRKTFRRRRTVAVRWGERWWPDTNGEKRR